MSYPILKDAEIEAFGKEQNGKEVEVSYDAGPAKNRQSLFFHGTLSRPSNTWVVTRRDKTINLQGNDIDVYNLTPYVRGQSTERTTHADLEASPKATRGEATDRARVRNPTTTTKTTERPSTMVVDNDSEDEREARRESDRTRKIDERRRAADDHRTADERHRAMDRREADMDDLQRQRDEINAERAEIARERQVDTTAARNQVASAQALATAQIQASTANSGSRPTTGDDVSFVNAYTRAEVERAMKALGTEHGGVYKVIIDKELWVIVRIEDETTAMFCPIHIMLEIPRHEPIERRSYDVILADIASNHKALTAKVDLRVAELGAAKPKPTQLDTVQYVSNRSAFKMAMAEYTKALTKFANDTRTALPTTRKGWNPVLEAAVKALRAFKDATVGHGSAKFVSYNWNYMFYQEHFNVLQLLATKLPPKVAE